MLQVLTLGQMCTQVAASLALWRIFSKDQAFITAMTAVERRIKDGHLSLAVSRACSMRTHATPFPWPLQFTRLNNVGLR